MARKRMIDPGIWDSEQVMTLTPAQFKLYIYLISQADDEGRVKASLSLLRGRVHPMNGYDEKAFETDLDSIANCGLVMRYGKHGEYISHPNWKVYQKINHPSKSHIPELSDTYPVYVRESSCSPTVGLPPNLIQSKRREVKGIEDTAPAALETPFLRRVEDGFLKRNGGQFTNWGRERKALNELLEKAKARDAEHYGDLLVSVCTQFWKLKQEDQTPKGFWRSQPFLPSALNASSIWDRVLESMRRDEGQEEALKLVEGRAR